MVFYKLVNNFLDGTEQCKRNGNTASAFTDLSSYIYLAVLVVTSSVVVFLVLLFIILFWPCKCAPNLKVRSWVRKIEFAQTYGYKEEREDGSIKFVVQYPKTVIGGYTRIVFLSLFLIIVFKPIMDYLDPYQIRVERKIQTVSEDLLQNFKLKFALGYSLVRTDTKNNVTTTTMLASPNITVFDSQRVAVLPTQSLSKGEFGIEVFDNLYSNQTEYSLVIEKRFAEDSFNMTTSYNIRSKDIQSSLSSYEIAALGRYYKSDWIVTSRNIDSFYIDNYVSEVAVRFQWVALRQVAEVALFSFENFFKFSLNYDPYEETDNSNKYILAASECYVKQSNFLSSKVKIRFTIDGDETFISYSVLNSAPLFALNLISLVGSYVALQYIVTVIVKLVWVFFDKITNDNALTVLICAFLLGGYLAGEYYAMTLLVLRSEYPFAYFLESKYFIYRIMSVVPASALITFIINCMMVWNAGFFASLYVIQWNCEYWAFAVKEPFVKFTAAFHESHVFKLLIFPYLASFFVFPAVKSVALFINAEFIYMIGMWLVWKFAVAKKLPKEEKAELQQPAL